MTKSSPQFRHPRMFLSGIQNRLKTWIPAFAGMTFLFVSSAHAVNLGLAKEDAGQPGAFLDFAASARSLAMGRAHVGVADDASAVYWNAAGLSQLDQKNFVGLYSVLEEDTGFGVANFGFPTIDYGTFGVGLVSLRSSNFEKRQGAILVGTYEQSDTGVLLSNGFKMNDRLSLGTTFKIVNQKVDTYSGTGYGADFGLMWAFDPRLQAGFVLRNLWAPKVELKSESETYPRDVRVGLKIQPGKNFLIATDMNKAENRSVKINLGTEWKIGNVMSLRAGLNDTEMTAGLGFKFDDWGLDYAFGYQQSVGGVDSLGGSHRVGFNLNFGQKVSDTGFSMRWQRKGAIVLELLREHMNDGEKPLSPDVKSLVDAGQEVIAHQGFTRAGDLYSAQGYISYFKAEYERSVQSLGEALALDPKNAELTKHIQVARRQTTEEQTKRIVAQEMKIMRELYESGDYQAAAASCMKVLNFMPDNVEAAAYLEDAKRRIGEPITRELRIAKTSYDREEYLDAIKHLQSVKQMDPQNSEADSLMAASISALEKKARLQYKAPKPQIAAKPKVFEIQVDSNKSRQLYSQGLMLYSRGKLKEAVAMWERAVNLDGDNQLARNAFNRGIAELQEAKTQ